MRSDDDPTISRRSLTGGTGQDVSSRPAAPPPSPSPSLPPSSPPSVVLLTLFVAWQWRGSCVTAVAAASLAVGCRFGFRLRSLRKPASSTHNRAGCNTPGVRNESSVALRCKGASETASLHYHCSHRRRRALVLPPQWPGLRRRCSIGVLPPPSLVVAHSSSRPLVQRIRPSDRGPPSQFERRCEPRSPWRR